MDFRQTFQAAGRGEAQANPAPGVAPQGKKDGKGPKLPAWLSILNIVVVVGALLLVIATAFVFISNRSDKETSNINTSLYQAVFLSNGQVYFGKVKTMNDRYISLSDVFYLTQSSSTTTTTTSSDYTLVKLGCQQIHYPKDAMFITRSQVTFWENLSNDGKVVKSIKEFQKQNPNGENCSTTSTDTQSTNSGTSATQNSSSTSNSSTTNSTSTSN